MTLLELGGGTNRHPQAEIVIDLHHPLRSHAQDATVVPWTSTDGPIPPSTIGKVYASHFMEHIPAGQPRLTIMNEAWRVLKRGGEFEIVVPCIGYTNHEGDGMPVYAGWQGWADPTHVSFWWYPESFWYLTGKFAPCADYGLLPWAEGSMELRGGWEAHVTLYKN